MTGYLFPAAIGTAIAAFLLAVFLLFMWFADSLAARDILLVLIGTGIGILSGTVNGHLYAAQKYGTKAQL